MSGVHMLDRLTHETFSPLVGQHFDLLMDDEASAGCELVAVKPLGSRRRPEGPKGREPFSLLFRASDVRELPQRIYRLEHRELGRLDVFLVPVGLDASGLQLEAVFT